MSQDMRDSKVPTPEFWTAAPSPSHALVWNTQSGRMDEISEKRFPRNLALFIDLSSEGQVIYRWASATHRPQNAVEIFPEEERRVGNKKIFALSKTEKQVKEGNLKAFVPVLLEDGQTVYLPANAASNTVQNAVNYELSLAMQEYRDAIAALIFPNQQATNSVAPQGESPFSGAAQSFRSSAAPHSEKPSVEVEIVHARELPEEENKSGCCCGLFSSSSAARAERQPLNVQTHAMGK